MRSTNFKRVLSVVLCAVLIAAMALLTAGCNNQTGKAGDGDVSSTAVSSDVSSVAEKTYPANGNTVGQGEKSFELTVTTVDGDKTVVTVKTDKKTVGDALLENDLIEGEDGEYGLYVKKVFGITADYDVDKTYWSFYIDGEYAMTGVDATDITEGAKYELKVTKSE